MRHRGESLVATLLAAALCLALPAWTRAEGAGSKLALGVVAEEPSEPDRMLRVYGELLAELRRRLAPEGVDVPPLVIARDLDDLSRRIVGGEVDCVVETAFPTLELERRSQRLQPALLVERRGQREYRSVFFTRLAAPIRRLQDLKGRTLVLQALRSTSAFAVPRAELARVGLRLLPADEPAVGGSAVKYRLAGAEVNQAVWVLHGQGDAGAFNDGDWAALPVRIREELRIFHETRPLIRGLLSFRTDLDPRTRARARGTLLGLDDDEPGRSALASAAGITRLLPLTAEDRASLREWARALGAVSRD